MTDDLNTKKFYQFLATKSTGGQGWDKYIDRNYGKKNDGVVIKAEFRNFMEAEWDWSGVSQEIEKRDIINQFWAEIDNIVSGKIKTSAGTTLNDDMALNAKEVEAINEELGIYRDFNVFISEKVKAPCPPLTTTAKQWKAAVTERLTEVLNNWVNAGKSGDLNAVLAAAYPAIAQEETAIWCAVEYQNTMLGVLKGYPYDLTEDATLNALLQNYINSLGPDATPEQIKKDVKAIVDAYFATAGLGTTANPELLESLGYQENGLNDLQKAVLTQNIKNALKDLAAEYAGYEDLLNVAIENFINSKVNSGKTFQELNAAPEVLANEFKTSTYKQDLDKMKEIYDKYINFDEKSSFYKQLETQFGKRIADYILENKRDITQLKTVVSDSIAKVLNGELAESSLENYVMNELAKLVNEIVAGFADELTVSELGDIYHNMYNAADNITDDAESLDAHRNAGLIYCDTLSKKGNAYSDAIAEVFGADGYEAYINGARRGDIKSKIEELAQLAAEIEKTEKENARIVDCKMPGFVDTTVQLGKTTYIDASVSEYLDENGKKLNVSGTPSYSCEPTTSAYGSKISINATTGRVTIDATNAKEENINLTVNVSINGRVITKSVTVHVAMDVSDSDVFNNVSGALVSTYNKKDATGDSLTGTVTSAKSMVNTYIDELAGLLVGETYNSELVSKAAQLTKDYYSALLAQVNDGSNYADNEGETEEYNISFDYTNAQGVTCTESLTYKKIFTNNHWFGDSAEELKSAAENTASTMDVASGIVLIEFSPSGGFMTSNTFAISVQKQAIANKFKDFYNQLK